MDFKKPKSFIQRAGGNSFAAKFASCIASSVQSGKARGFLGRFR